MSLFFILIVSARLREIPNPQLFVTQNVHSLSLMQRRETVGEKLSRHWYGWIDPAGRAATSGLEWHMHRTADTRTVNKNTIRIIKLCVAAGLHDAENVSQMATSNLHTLYLVLPVNAGQYHCQSQIEMIARDNAAKY